jgi:hypothetical protein
MLHWGGLGVHSRLRRRGLELLAGLGIGLLLLLLLLLLLRVGLLLEWLLLRIPRRCAGRRSGPSCWRWCGSAVGSWRRG